jgi:hypothetical protein
MQNHVNLKEIWRSSKKILLIITCLLTLTFTGFFVSSSPAIADLGEYGRGDGMKDFKDKAEDLNRTIDNLPDQASIKAKEVAKSIQGDKANEIHGRARYDLGKAQNALEKDATEGTNIIKEIGDKISSQLSK